MDDKEKILHKLYEIRSDEFHSTLAEEHRKQLEKNETTVKREELIQVVKKLFILDEEKTTKMIASIDEYESAFVAELDFWCEKFYMLGFADAQKLKEECKGIGEENE